MKRWEWIPVAAGAVQYLSDDWTGAEVPGDDAREAAKWAFDWMRRHGDHSPECPMPDVVTVRVAGTVEAFTFTEKEVCE